MGFLFIGAPPQIVTGPQNLTIVEQSDATFTCDVSGAPVPDVVWKKGMFDFRLEVTTSYYLVKMLSLLK